MKSCLYINVLNIDKDDDNRKFEEIPQCDVLEHEPRILVNTEAEEVHVNGDDI